MNSILYFLPQVNEMCGQILLEVL